MQTAIRFTPMAKRLNVSAQHIQTIAEATASSFFQAIKGDDGKMITEIRPSDGFINATRMCASGRKNWSDYIRLTKTIKYKSARLCCMFVVIPTHARSVR